jgi:hypothetical protein
MVMYKPKRVNTAIFMLYAVSVLGILELFTSASVLGKITPLVSVDIIAYVCLFLVSFLISKGIGFARVLYILLAVVWYAILIFYLPENYHHELNAGLVFIELVMIIASMYMLFQKKSMRWFEMKSKHTKCE